MQPLFGSWLEQTAELQRSAYGYDPGNESDFETWIDYVRTQTLAAFVELGEFLQGLTWKPWAKEKRSVHQRPGDRENAIEEMVDVLHFVANCLYAMRVTDEELNEAYNNKMRVNRARMARGGH